MAFLKQRSLWIGLLAVVGVVMLFGLAMIGSVIGSKPKNVPVALVALDKGAVGANGVPVQVGEMMKQQLLTNDQLPVQFEIVSSVYEARAGLNEQRYYGALILPASLSENITSIATPQPRSGQVDVLINEGVNMQASAFVQHVLNEVTMRVNQQLHKQLTESFKQQGEVKLTLDTAKALLQPIQVNYETVHPIGSNHGGGNAPNMLTQLAWISSLAISLVLYVAVTRSTTNGGKRWLAICAQVSSGIVLTGIISGLILWMTVQWYGMETSNATELWLILWLAGAVFFLLQSSLLNWLGLIALPIIILLLFFSLPVLAMAPPFLPQATQDWLYAWTPLRFVASSLRDALYFDTEGLSHAAVLWSLFTVCLAVVGTSVWRKAPAPSEVSNSNQPTLKNLYN
ncbi:YhgE/Pip domain-containing protein [Paenibacillus agilis]|uniref:DUF3533 domain-containing protein n=1 Tax=Paenibacillus agilis TaxID=3020863 RepID=A0A559IW60_9BACL|nr:ABC transporter permease [Paenibacillus agilis]TVX91869.1 DUF3533 domain-containing protein [Paenibacillus agilis]